MSTDPEIVRATVRGVPDVVATRVAADGAWRTATAVSDYAWRTATAVSDYAWHCDDDVTDRVPLRLVDESTHVVIDPEDDEQVNRIRMGSLASAAFLRKNLRSMLKPVEPPEPPIPPEPEGDFVAVDIHGQAWTRDEINGFHETEGEGWERAWRFAGPFTIYRPEVKG